MKFVATLAIVTTSAITTAVFAQLSERSNLKNLARPNGQYCAQCKVPLPFSSSGMDPRRTTIAQREDRTFLQGISDDRIGFSRGLSAVGKDVIMRHDLAYGGLKPPPIDHQGIDDAFVGKASVTWYFYLGRWMALQGAD